MNVQPVLSGCGLHCLKASNIEGLLTIGGNFRRYLISPFIINMKEGISKTEKLENFIFPDECLSER